jgi:hypothetical protein
MILVDLYETAIIKFLHLLICLVITISFVNHVIVYKKDAFERIPIFM